MELKFSGFACKFLVFLGYNMNVIVLPFLSQRNVPSVVVFFLCIDH